MAVAGLTKRFFNHIQKDFLINVWGYIKMKIQKELLSKSVKKGVYALLKNFGLPSG